ncbi:hypothetical protein L484_020780 [Morus notabilis]|uniref:Uncharacterized protein n=1 Tax=Morus notabilis TaxID=981085 RepID=W9RV85_9ROSA|nr:hypothetical protein L484_020780 [Morus notabilis]
MGVRGVNDKGGVRWIFGGRLGKCESEKRVEVSTTSMEIGGVLWTVAGCKNCRPFVILVLGLVVEGLKSKAN